MAFTSADLTAIDAAIAAGENTVEVNGRKIVYRDVEQLIKARNLIASQISKDTQSTNIVRRGSFAVRFQTARE